MYCVPLNLKIWLRAWLITVNISADVSLTETCVYFHKKERPPAKHGLLKVAPEPNLLPTPDLGFT